MHHAKNRGNKVIPLAILSRTSRLEEEDDEIAVLPISIADSDRAF